MDDPDSDCAHTFIGGAEHTIISLPNSCGLGPFARIVTLKPHTDQSVLPLHHSSKKPQNEQVYALHFDYDFSVIPESNGPIYMRAGELSKNKSTVVLLMAIDVTDLPGYWLVLCNMGCNIAEVEKG